MAIPLAKLNCTHCKLLREGNCAVTGEKIKDPSKRYCFRIFNNFKEGTR